MVNPDRFEELNGQAQRKLSVIAAHQKEEGQKLRQEADKLDKGWAHVQQQRVRNFLIPLGVAVVFSLAIGTVLFRFIFR
jgi:hypothetical protein